MSVFSLKLGSCFMILLMASFVAPVHAGNIKIIIIGDSTVSDYSGSRENNSLAGWGQVLSEFLSKDVTVINLAKAGASSKSYFEGGYWDKAKNVDADYLFIQFGHNDQAGKATRSTDPNGDFVTYMKHYIHDARVKNIRPVLITPVARRVFKHGKAYSKLSPYVNAMIKVGKDEGVPVIDLHMKSLEYYNKLGPKDSLSLGPNGDHTHFSLSGARSIAKLFVGEIPNGLPELKQYISIEYSN